MNQPGGAEGLVFEIGGGHQNGIAVPPQRPLSFADAGEEIDYAQLNLQQADGKVVPMRGSTGNLPPARRRLSQLSTE